MSYRIICAKTAILKLRFSISHFSLTCDSHDVSCLLQNLKISHLKSNFGYNTFHPPVNFLRQLTWFEGADKFVSNVCVIIWDSQFLNWSSFLWSLLRKDVEASVNLLITLILAFLLLTMSENWFKDILYDVKPLEYLRLCIWIVFMFLSKTFFLIISSSWLLYCRSVMNFNFSKLLINTHLIDNIV